MCCPESLAFAVYTERNHSKVGLKGNEIVQLEEDPVLSLSREWENRSKGEETGKEWRRSEGEGERCRWRLPYFLYPAQVCAAHNCTWLCTRSPGLDQVVVGSLEEDVQKSLGTEKSGGQPGPWKEGSNCTSTMPTPTAPNVDTEQEWPKACCQGQDKDGPPCPGYPGWIS